MTMAQNILIAEDEDNDFLLLNRAFSRLERKVSIRRARDGVEAISYLEKAEPSGNGSESPVPDLVILDLKMPRKDGFDVLNWIRSHPRYKPLIVVILSSSNQERDIARAYISGANSYLTKPNDFSGLAEMVQILTNYWLHWSCRASYPTMTIA